MRYMILIILTCTLSLPWAVSEETAFDPAFCLDGDIMQQLLQGFGSTILVDEVSGRVLNCEARVIREEIIDDVGVIDIELDCECADPDGDDTSPDQLQGHWSIALDY